MTDASEIARLASDIAALIRNHGYPDKAAWLDARAQKLADPNTGSSEVTESLSELHGIVLGMGGLMDMNLAAAPSSTESPTAARERLDDLADQLYQATK